MSDKLVAACLQLNSTADVATNLAHIEPMIRDAAGRGAKLIALPENLGFIIADRARLMAAARTENEDPAVAFLSRMATETGTWILGGSIAVAIGGDRLANRSFLFTPQGEIAARYDKIHLYDATLSDTERYRESDYIRGGDTAVVADTPWGKLGLSICYDLRFPQLYRALAKTGANLITVPAAFPPTTGKPVWHVLVRARAIETSCFVLAPAQCGAHDGGRLTYGHSLIVAPGGNILAEGSDEPCVILAELDLAEVGKARRRIPCLEHDRDFTGP